MYSNARYDAEGMERRQYYRICYPRCDHPVLRIQALSYRVIDMSEKGIRFALDATECLPLATDVGAVLIDPLGAELPVSGDLLLQMPLRLGFLTRPEAAERGQAQDRSLRGCRTLRLWNREYEVTALDGNLRYLHYPTRLPLESFPAIWAEVILTPRESIHVNGKLYRAERDYCVILLGSGIPFGRIMSEQIRMRRRFRHLY